MSDDALPSRRAQTLAAIGALIIFAYWQLWLLLRFDELSWFNEPDGKIWGVVDDVYISACFGRSLWSGHGFLWYPGAPRVEGITNPLWSALLGLLQRAPGFHEPQLGLWVLALNACLLCLWVSLCARALQRAAADGAALAWALPLGFASLALPFWSAEGFEVALIAVFAFAMLALSIDAREPRRCGAIGVLLGLGVVTRMDFVFVAIPALSVVLSGPSRWRRLAWTLLPALLIVLAGLAARRWYYAQWLPNTYYLKATGWPARPRLLSGLRQNRALLPSAFGCWAPIAHPDVRARIRGRLPAMVGALAAFCVTLAYSVWVGGDSWSLHLGYDRHTVVGSVCLLWALSLFVVSLDAPALLRLFALLWALCIAVAPAWRGPRSQVELHYLTSNVREAHDGERDWIRQGLAFENISYPGARIAVCPAGAMIYFSHRGGVDLLGKIDPVVARLPVSLTPDPNRGCWQRFPGHNKGDDLATFRRTKPEFSDRAPPRELRGEYVRVAYHDLRFYVRRDTRLARWERLVQLDSH